MHKQAFLKIDNICLKPFRFVKKKCNKGRLWVIFGANTSNWNTETLLRTIQCKRHHLSVTGGICSCTCYMLTKNIKALAG